MRHTRIEAPRHRETPGVDDAPTGAPRVQSTSRVAVVRSGDGARLWTRNRHDISDRFPDVVIAAVRQLPDGVVLDGELVILGADGRLSFDALQQRLVTSPAKARGRAAVLPASFAAFDMPAAGGIDLRTQRWTVLQQRLEQLTQRWVPPLQLTPVTADLDEATEWFEVLPAAMGVEGLVVKGAATRYTPGRRDAWVKVNSVGMRGVRFSFDAWMCLVSVLPRTGSWCATGVADGRTVVPLGSFGNRSAGGRVWRQALAEGNELAGAVEDVPGVRAVCGGARYEPKWDGYLH